MTEAEFITNLLPHSRRIAAGMVKKAPTWMDAEDLSQDALLGMLETRRAKPAATFNASFISARMRWDILDAIRQGDGDRRQFYAFYHIMLVADDLLTHLYKSPPTHGEMAACLQVPEDQYLKMMQRWHPRNILSIDAVAYDLASDTNVEHDAVMHAEIECVRRAFSFLAKREQCCLTLHFCDGISLRTIGEQYGLTEGRICQIVKGALRKLLQSSAEKEERCAA